MHSQTNLDSTYKNALEWTDPSQHKIPEVGSEQEQSHAPTSRRFIHQLHLRKSSK